MIAELENRVGQAKLRGDKYDSGNQQGAGELGVDLMADVGNGRREPPDLRPENVDGDDCHQYEENSQGQGNRGGTAFRRLLSIVSAPGILRAYLPRPEICT